MKVGLKNLSYLLPLESPSKVNSAILPINNEQQSALELNNVIVFPGLTNAHDHLEFNLFPFLADRIYADYKEWGADIHRRYKSEIEAVLKIPMDLRFRWGIFKNLISGVTCVVHHGTNYGSNLPDYPVYLNYQYLHSLSTEPFWRLKLILSRKKNVMIHIGEGTSEESKRETDTLVNGNLRHRNLIGIHAISMNEHQSKKFKSIIWCPDSNIKLYGKTADINSLKKHTTILFGTDSALSASSNIGDHLRLARRLNLLSDKEIFSSLTDQPCKVFPDLNNKGIVIAKNKTNDPWDSFFSLQPEDVLLVILNDEVILADESILKNCSGDYRLIRVGNTSKWIQHSFASVVGELEAIGVTLPLPVRSVR